MNGQEVNSSTRLAYLKTQSEKFKQDYVKSLVNSFESHYVLDVLLGQGMHASVHKCFKIDDNERERPYAVKIIRDDDDEKILIH